MDIPSAKVSIIVHVKCKDLEDHWLDFRELDRSCDCISSPYASSSLKIVGIVLKELLVDVEGLRGLESNNYADNW